MERQISEVVKASDTLTFRRPSRAYEPRFRRLTRVYAEPTDAEPWISPASLVPSDNFVIGREGDLSLDDRTASRRHARLTIEPALDVVAVEDLDSKNGTYLNGQPITGPEPLRDGAVLRIGATILVFEEVLGATSESLEACPAHQSLGAFIAEERVAKAAPTDLPVLIRGPTGSGKERLAERVHAESGRKGPLVSLNCATLSPDLIASELFGHLAGAFSGAKQNRPGLFRTADGGTLFLDEFAELSIEQQPALLRALQERRVRPVGADAEVAVNTRVVSATHQDLEQLESDGRVRSDLLARLSGVVVVLPGLSERRVEILPLLRTFVGPDARPPSAAAAEALLLYGWPKNIRELQQCANHLRLFGSGEGMFEPSDLPFGETAAVVVSPPSKEAPVVPEPPMGPAPPDRAPSTRRDREEWIRLLQERDGNVAEVARALGLHRQQVYRRLQALGIKPVEFRRSPP